MPTGLSLEELVGRWQRTDATARESPYPKEVEFFRDGTYRATTAGRRSVWDEASFDIVSPEQLQMETASDRKARYRATLDGDQLTIGDGGDRVAYTRVR